MRSRSRYIVGGIALAAWACGGSAPSAGRADAAPLAAPSAGVVGGVDQLTRVVGPFAVLDSTGSEYDFPFLGGLNVPRPQMLDIDGDGDVDLFVQETTGAVKFFENVGTPERMQLEWRSDRYLDLDVGEWYRFADVDEDGDWDLLTEKRFSYITYYQNYGSSGAPDFRVAVDTLLDDQGEAIFSDRQNIPNVTDIDCDDHLDLLIGRLTGTVTRYESVRTIGDGMPQFRHVGDRFEGIEIVANPVGSLHGANTLVLADIDGDGDQDFFWGDFFEQGILFIENHGSCSDFSLRSEPIQFPVGQPVLTSGYNASAFADVDSDGDLDLLVGVLGGAYNPNTTSRDNLIFLEQVGPGSFEERTRRFLRMIDVGSESTPYVVDYDGDGDLDLLVSNKIEQDDTRSGRIYFFENRGTRTEPRFALAGRLPFQGSYHHAPAFGDMDGDGDLDIIMGSWSPSLSYYRNDSRGGNVSYTLVEEEIARISRGSNTTPTLGDLDGDGDLDMLVGEASGTFNYFINVGSSRSPEFEAVTDKVSGIDVGLRAFPFLVDWDGDGDLDVLAGTDDGLELYLNTGSARDFVLSPDPMPIPFDVGSVAAPAMGDIDADGDLDLFVGNSSGGLYFFENTTR